MSGWPQTHTCCVGRACWQAPRGIYIGQAKKSFSPYASVALRHCRRAEYQRSWERMLHQQEASQTAVHCSAGLSCSDPESRPKYSIASEAGVLLGAYLVAWIAGCLDHLHPGVELIKVAASAGARSACNAGSRKGLDMSSARTGVYAAGCLCRVRVLVASHAAGRSGAGTAHPMGRAAGLSGASRNMRLTSLAAPPLACRQSGHVTQRCGRPMWGQDMGHASDEAALGMGSRSRQAAAHS